MEAGHGGRPPHPRGPEQWPRTRVGPRSGVGFGRVVEPVHLDLTRVPGQPLELVLHEDEDASHLFALGAEG